MPRGTCETLLARTTHSARLLLHSICATAGAGDPMKEVMLVDPKTLPSDGIAATASHSQPFPHGEPFATLPPAPPT